jgi:hypothetical protein
MYSRDRTIAELQRRADLLSVEINDWNESASQNVDQMGTHKSQFWALKEMMDGLLARQTQLLKELSPEQSAQQFAERHYRLLMEIAGTQNLWGVFRYIFAQLEEKRLGLLVDAANRVAADCYITCLDHLRDWRLITEQQYREPPLVYLQANITPATLTRGKKVEALGFPLWQYPDLRLPIPIVCLPPDHADCLWLFCALYHEVGHNLDQDLKLGRELKQHLDTKLEAERVPDDQREVWRRWTSEILADVFGVLLGGAGFSHSLASLLLVMAPRKLALDTENAHPDNYVRIYLVAELLRQSRIEALKQDAGTIMQMWEAQAKPNGIEDYLQACAPVVQIFLTQRLKALGDRRLLDLAPDLEGDAKNAAKLANFLRTGNGFDKPIVPCRLVPVAAELRLLEMDKPSKEELQELQKRSLGYLNDLKRPKFLGAADRSEYLRQLIDKIDFTKEESI